MSDCKGLCIGFGRVVMERRVELGLDRDEFAKRLGESARYVRAVEAGEHHLYLTDIQLIAEALDISVVDLLREAESDVPSV
ncbi:MAG: helix-turn-helix domain-containing protein [Armatimonadota bacterium]